MEQANCVDCGKPLSDTVLAAGLTRCTPCSAQRLGAAMTEPSERSEQAGEPSKRAQKAGEPFALIQQIPRPLRGPLHLLASIAGGFVFAIFVTVVLMRVGGSDSLQAVLGVLSWPVSFVVYWLWRGAKEDKEARNLPRR